MSNLAHLLSIALSENYFSLNETAKHQLLQYLHLLQIWNKVFNLTTITKPRDMVYLHIIDSLAVEPYLKGGRFLDVGSGAGLPGIPLAIAHPEQQWVLLDKNSKKTRFLTQAIAEIGLKNVSAIHSRCEDFHPAACFDSILSRAFGTIQMFTEETAHLLCPEGQWIAMKGKYPEDELKHLSLHFKVGRVERLNLKGMDIERHIAVIQKT